MTLCIEVPWCLGRLPGAPWRGVPAQCLRPRSGRARLVFASFFISILIPMFDRLGVVLGSVLGAIFGHVGALVGQSWSQSPLRTVLTSKTRFFKKTSATEGESTILRSKSAQDGAQDDPRSPQDVSKIVLDRFFRLLIFRFVFASFLVPCWCRFGLPNGAPGVPPN